jgi:hypothetical protein
MIRWLKQLIAWWRAPTCPGAEVVKNGDATFWDIAQSFEQPELESGRVEYRFLGVTGEEDA